MNMLQFVNCQIKNQFFWHLLINQSQNVVKILVYTTFVRKVFFRTKCAVNFQIVVCPSIFLTDVTGLFMTFSMIGAYLFCWNFIFYFIRLLSYLNFLLCNNYLPSDFSNTWKTILLNNLKITERNRLLIERFL